ncbi:MAG: hypothetical protein ACPGKS_01005 [Coraliomargarita sp.]
MKLNKTLTTALTGAALFGASADAEIILTDEISLYGYLDIYHADQVDGSDVESEQTVAEFELGMNFTSGDSPFFAVMELSFRDDVNEAETEGGDAYEQTDDLDFETAIVGYNYSDELVVTAGNILSYQGWETYDATGLYQFSYAGRGFSPFYTAGYAVGAAADYVTEDFALGVWVGDSDVDTGTSWEFLAAYTGIEGLTVKGIYAMDPGYDTYNVWASYEIEGFTFAAEYIYSEADETNGLSFGEFDDSYDVDESTGYLLMVNYAWEKAGLTFRYSVQEDEVVGGDDPDDWECFTLSPSYMLSDNLLVLAEISSYEGETGDEEYYAVEFIYTF